MARSSRAGRAPLGAGLRGNPFGGAGAFSHLSLRPSRGAQLLAGLLVFFTAVQTWVPSVSTWLILGPTTVPELHVTALLTNGLVAMPGSFIGMLIFAAIAGLLFFDRVRALWDGDRPRLIGGAVGALVVSWAINLWIVPGRFWGLATGVITILWFATGVERKWGTRRLLTFVAIISVATNVLGALVSWAWTAIPFVALNGEQPLMHALLTVWFLMAGRRMLPMFNIEARKLVWLLVVLDLFDLIFVDVARGLMGLFAIGLSWALINGYHHPGRVIDRIRLALIERRIARRREGFEVIDGGRNVHRGATSGGIA